jgi:glycosyltransferase involved in cell wall biosynthesis
MPGSAPVTEKREPRISVVAPTYRRRDGLPAFVEPLLADPALDELVVAVDGSGDGSVEWLQERARNDPRLVVLDLPNRGAGPTRQAGIERATGDLVLLMDDDVIAEPGLAAGHRSHHRDGADRLLVLGYMPNDWLSLPPGRRGIAKIYHRAYESAVARFATDPDHILLGLWAGNFSLPRQEFLRIGIETRMELPRGQDDREFGIRCFRVGIRGRFDPTLRARHLYDRSLVAFRRDCYIQGETRRLIHDLHADVVGHDLVGRTAGSEVLDAVGLGLPAPLRPLLPWLARPPLFGALVATLTGVFHLSVRLRIVSLEVFAARGIGSLETQRGVLARS